MEEPQELVDPSREKKYYNRKPAWLREAILGAERYGALEEMHKERKRTRSYSIYAALLCAMINKEPSNYEDDIPKSCHHHVIRPLTSMFSLNPSTWSGNLLCLSILHEKTQHRAFLAAHERYLALHRLYPIFHKWCHLLWSLVHKHFSSKPLCHKRRKVVPWVKWEKEKFLEASRS